LTLWLGLRGELTGSRFRRYAAAAAIRPSGVRTPQWFPRSPPPGGVETRRRTAGTVPRSPRIPCKLQDFLQTCQLARGVRRRQGAAEELSARRYRWRRDRM